jgi:6-phosphogluconolactonase
MSAFPAILEILPDAEALARHAADWLLAAALAKQGRFAVALSGGATPRRLYETLATPRSRDSFPWSRTHWFWGDERFVPPGDPASNFHMTDVALLSHAPVPAQNIHPIPTEGMGPIEAAAGYESELKTFYGAQALDGDRPLFDVTFLGLGLDGHTASLFPDTDAINERERWVLAVMGARTETRITLTYAALESTVRAAFLVSGKDKTAVLKRLLHGDAALPAARLRPSGSLQIFADAAAAKGGGS